MKVENIRAKNEWSHRKLLPFNIQSTLQLPYIVQAPTVYPLREQINVFAERNGKRSTRPWRRQWQPTPVLLPRKSHGWRSLVSCSPCGREESNMTERLHFHFSLSCIREGNGNPLLFLPGFPPVLAWRIPGTAEPGGLPSMGSHRVGHD